MKEKGISFIHFLVALNRYTFPSHHYFLSTFVNIVVYGMLKKVDHKKIKKKKLRYKDLCGLLINFVFGDLNRIR